MRFLNHAVIQGLANRGVAYARIGGHWEMLHELPNCWIGGSFLFAFFGNRAMSCRFVEETKYQLVAPMFIFGRTSANAIAVVSHLAADPSKRSGSPEIAKSRGLSVPLTAKLLTQLSSAGIVNGQPGPGGGYSLEKPASSISLYDIVSLFEPKNSPSVCPFGRDWCGKGDPCPIHDDVVKISETNEQMLKGITLAVFFGKNSVRHEKILEEILPVAEEKSAE